MNAAVASGVSAQDFAAPFDSVWLDLSKGLGCPIGGVLAGSTEFIEEAWTWKHRFGGAMRQAGILAAAGLYAREHHVDRLAEDHANARLFADRLSEVPGIVLDPPEVETNLVFFNMEQTGPSAKEVSDRLLEKGYMISGGYGPLKEKTFRISHLGDIMLSDIEELLSVIDETLNEMN